MIYLRPIFLHQDTRVMLFFVFFSFIPVSLSTLNERNWIWNSSTETWLDFHVKYCGRFCTGDTLNGNNYCNNPPCFPCDCDSNCFIYDTCCPLFVNNSYIEPPLNEIEQLPGSDIFQCETLPYIQTKDKYYIVSSCDPKFSLQNINVLEQSSRNIADLCRNPNTRTLDDMTPYSDILYGIIFANKFCAMCNGYGIDDNTNHKNSSVSASAIASAWFVDASCEHYQKLYHLTSEYEFLLAAANMSKCKINMLPPLTILEPKSCGSEDDTFSAATCGDFDIKATHLCHSLNRRYLKAGAKANIFCHLCSNSSIAKSFCVPPTRIPISSPGFSRSRAEVHEPPYSLLLSFKKLPGKGSIEEMNCKVHKEWQDLKVIFQFLITLKF
uniref:SMB domain-containing protein n=1 Tax=Biomphalaria glabrata TaxID=6526 RepID=A0A2C9LRD9_BIOGL